MDVRGGDLRQCASCNDSIRGAQVWRPDDDTVSESMIIQPGEAMHLECYVFQCVAVYIQHAKKERKR